MEQNTNIERITELQGIDIPTCEPVAKTNNVMSGVLLGFAGLGVIESCAIAGFGVYKLVKYLKAKKAQKAEAEVVDIVEEPVEVVEE